MGRAELVYLVQTDTTVGFASKSAAKLDRIKGRPEGKPYLQTVGTLKELKNGCRVPKALRKRVRRSGKTTFVYPDGIARRFVGAGDYAAFLKMTGPVHSTSANRSGHGFEPEWAAAHCDVVVHTPAGFAQKASSSIFKMGKEKVTQLR